MIIPDGVVSEAPKNLQAVRKEFKRNSGYEDNYEKELRNLNLLNELRHPNIVELLSSYTHRGKHNLIFRLACDGNLTNLLENDCPVDFHSEETFFLALSKLSSAIATVHEFASKSLNLKYIGCHHDLKPKNILVHGSTFILADFGLSKLKEATESSKEEFQVGAGHYLAPECEDYDSHFEKHIISRPSDVWSFGCIIAEVLTYMKRGREGVAEFKRIREVKIRNFKTFTFHAGRFKPHPRVRSWLSGLESQDVRTDQMCVQLVTAMLAIDPKDRPTAQQVTSRLRLIAVTAHIRSLDELFTELLQITESIEADIEGRRFNGWEEVFESVTSNDGPWNTVTDRQLAFDSILDCLIKSIQEMQFIISRYSTALSPLFSGLRALIDQLMNLLPIEYKEQARTRLELDLIQSEDATVLETTRRRYKNTSLGERIGMLLTIKRMSLLAFQRAKECRPDLYLDPNSVTFASAEQHTLEDHDLATIKDKHDHSERRVLVEWIRYNTHWEGPVSEEMIARVEAIAELLSSTTNPADFRLLHCSGFFHQPDRHAFGLVYDFPCPPSIQLSVTPQTLADIIRITKDTRSRPFLGDRFSLAYKLAICVLEFHKVGWLHKSISPYNIAFFPSKHSKPPDWIKDPYIIGFNRSRPDEPKAFTEGPAMNAKFKKYQHPLYVGEQRFRPEFDYYSLGLVLLEIGLWKLLDDLTAGWKYYSSSEMREMLLEKRVPLLAHAMGTNYRAAVKACFTGNEVLQSSADSDAGYMPEITTSLRLSFSTQVLEALSRCPHEEQGTFGMPCTSVSGRLLRR